MAFGIKQVKVATKNSYSVETLYEAIKDKEFSIGQPELVKQGFAMVIAFPAVDRNNQVQITQGFIKGKEGSKWLILKAEAAGTENLVANAVLETATNGASGLGKLGGKNSKLVEKQVDTVAAEFKALGL